jgi:hypothetical protein
MLPTDVAPPPTDSSSAHPKPIDIHYHAIRLTMGGVFHELGLAA